ncbi:MAG: endolytic transglycosylase MltG [Spiribacter sp.]|nr:endolytic transglycosylase MltG [Spiribacter sp.]
MRRQILTWGGLLAAGLVIAGGLWLGQGLIAVERSAMVEETAESREIMPFVVRSGESFREVAERLQDRGLLHHPLHLRIYARWQSIADQIQPGEYALEPGLSAGALIRRMARGRVVQHELTIIEGWRFQTLWQALRAHPAVTPTLPADAEASAIMSAIDRGDIAPEGQFLPETYRFPRGTRDVDILRRANRDLEAVLRQAWAERAPGLPLDNAQEALILASIIEKETGVPEERRTIAGVFTRRLEKGMRLQTDPTVIYGLGEGFDGDIRHEDLRRDTPFNTYTRHGLPPTPIALPGAASIRAAVDPAEGDALYFVSRGDGSHYFSATYEEHNQAVRRYQLGLEDDS